MKIFNGFILLLFISFTCSNCAYYGTNKSSQITESKLAIAKSPKKFAIIHLQDNILALNNIVIRAGILEADVSHLPEEHLKHLYPKSNHKNRYEKKNAPIVLNEIHIYSESIRSDGSGHVSIPLSSITPFDVYQHNQDATTSSHIIGTISLLIDCLAIFGIAVASGFLNMFQ